MRFLVTIQPSLVVLSQILPRNAFFYHFTAFPGSLKPKPTKIDYDYAGPPYRVFNEDGTQAQQFTEGQTYLMRLKKILGRGENAKLIDANREEVARVRKHINDLQDITDKAKESLLARIDDLPLGGKNG